MFPTKDLLVSLLLAATALPCLSSAIPPTSAYTLAPRDGRHSIVYHGDSRSPDEIRAAGGLWAKGFTSRNTKATVDASLYKHCRLGQLSRSTSADDDGFISFSASFRIAELAVLQSYIDGGDGWIYQVHTDDKFVDVAATLGKYNPHDYEKELAALCGVPFDQIMGWKQFVDERQQQTHAFEPNPKYDRAYDGQRDAGAAPWLAGFPAGHEAWEEEPWEWFVHCDTTLSKSDKNLRRRFTAPTSRVLRSRDADEDDWQGQAEVEARRGPQSISTDRGNVCQVRRSIRN